ncbi:MAG: NAD-dependent epimerase/dehydratase family protein, partial [bacterium]|nr:NAD-dependent epimerase/dehydratase family protein [bacterium]
LAGGEAVIHGAGVTAEGTPDEALSRRVNVEGAAALFEAARRAGVSRWIQISSMSAHPASTSVYGRTKLAADEFLRRSAPPPRWTILRPSLIYGPGDQGLVAKTLRILRKLPVLPMVGSGRELLRPRRRRAGPT